MAQAVCLLKSTGKEAGLPYTSARQACGAELQYRTFKVALRSVNSGYAAMPALSYLVAALLKCKPVPDGLWTYVAQ